jgi:hypothetical protein
MCLRPGDLVFKLLTSGGNFGLRPSDLVALRLCLTFQVEDLHLKVVFSLLCAHLFGLALIDYLSPTLDLGLSLGKILLYLSTLEADDVALP